MKKTKIIDMMKGIGKSIKLSRKGGVSKIDLGFMKVERIKTNDKAKSNSHRLISIEHNKKPTMPAAYKPTLESNIDINVVPKSLSHLIKQEKVVKPKLHKPKGFSKLIREIKLMFSNIIIFNGLLISLMLFLASYMILMLMDLNVKYSFVLSFVYLLLYLFLKLREDKYKKIESIHSNLDEKIRTAVDNIYVENPVVDDLRNEISTDMKNVDYAGFFSDKSTSYKIFLIILLCFGVILLGKYDVEFKVDMEKVFGFLEGGEGNQTGIIADIISAASGGVDEDIFGDEYLAELGSEELTIGMNRVGFEINLDDVKDPSSKDFEQSLFPDEIGLEKSKVYVQKDIEQHKELVKNYFKNMAQD